MAEFLTVKCPCGNILRASVAHAGKKGRCPKCGQLVQLPAAPAAAPPPKTPKPAAPPPRPADGIPKCKNHSDREAVLACVGCRSFLCQECANTHKGVTFCDICLRKPEVVKTLEVREAREALLRKKGMAAGDFSGEFRTRTSREAAEYALAAMTRDGRLLYFAIPLLFSVSCLSAMIVGIGAEKGWLWFSLLAVVITAAFHLFSFGGFVGAAKDMLFGMPFDLRRFLAHSKINLAVSWPALLICPVVGFLAGPAIWKEPGNSISRSLFGGGLFGIFFTLSLPAVIAIVENSGIKIALRCSLHHCGTHFLSVLGVNLTAGIIVWLWLFTAGGILKDIPILPDALTGLVMSLVYVTWVMATICMYLSLSVSKQEINAKAPSEGLPVPKGKLTNIAVGIALVVAVALGATFHLRFDRESVKKSVRIVSFRPLMPWAWSKSETPPTPPSNASPQKKAN